MASFFLAESNFWFNVAIGTILALFLLEVASMLFGISVLGMLDTDADVDVDADLDSGGFSSVLNWLSIDKLPTMVWLTLLLVSFGVLGYITNFVFLKTIGSFAPAIISLPVAAIVGLIVTGRMGGIIARMMPKNESSAVTTDEFVGNVAQITLGKAVVGSPAEAKFIDQHNQPHYLMVEPMEGTDSFVQGDQVILVQKTSSGWLATRYQ